MATMTTKAPLKLISVGFVGAVVVCVRACVHACRCVCFGRRGGGITTFQVKYKQEDKSSEGWTGTFLLSSRAEATKYLHF